jgi:hypothetical protein
VEYPWRLLINPLGKDSKAHPTALHSIVHVILIRFSLHFFLDSCIDALVIRGAMQMARFLGGERFITIQWLEKKQTERDLMKPNIFRRVIAPLTIVGIVLWRSVGLATIMDWLETFAAAGYQITDSIVPLTKGQEMFMESTVYYIARSLYSNIVAILDKLHLLI